MGCYKVILDCSVDNKALYEKCGFKQKEVQMVKFHLRNTILSSFLPIYVDLLFHKEKQKNLPSSLPCSQQTGNKIAYRNMEGIHFTEIQGIYIRTWCRDNRPPTAICNTMMQALVRINLGTEVVAASTYKFHYFMSTNNTSCRNNIYGSCKCSHNWHRTTASTLTTTTRTVWIPDKEWRQQLKLGELQWFSFPSPVNLSW